MQGAPTLQKKHFLCPNINNLKPLSRMVVIRHQHGFEGLGGDALLKFFKNNPRPPLPPTPRRFLIGFRSLFFGPRPKKNFFKFRWEGVHLKRCTPSHFGPILGGGGGVPRPTPPP